MPRTATTLVTGALLFAAPVQAQRPALEDLLSLVAAYHESYASRVSGVTLEENYGLIQVVLERMQTPVRFNSDVVLLNVNGRILGLRDPYAVDNVPLRERTPRITNLLREPTVAAWNQAQKYPAEQHFRFISDLVLACNDPTLALQFIAPEMQARSTFKLEKQETLNGVAVARIGFSEVGNRDTRYTLRTRGNASAAGRLWIDVSTGAVLKSELRVTSSTESVVVNVSYAKDAALDLWLPQKMDERYQWKELDDVRSNRDVGGYGARLFFQSNAYYTNVRYTPVDLNRMLR
jgi:hypothetical protein